MDILEILKKPESKNLEFKRDLSSPDGMLKTVISFANTAGGLIIIGVDDGNHHVRGIQTPLQLEERISNLISDNIHPKLIPNIEIIPWRNTYLVAIEIYPSSSRPHFLKSVGFSKGVYVRIGSSNRVADSNLIDELRRMSRGESFDEQPFPELDINSIDFKVATELFADFRKLKKSDLETLTLVTNYQNRLVPTNAGIILFGIKRNKYFPNAWIHAGRFSGKTKTNITESIEIHSYPVLAIKEAIAFIEKHLFSSIKITKTERVDEWKIPQIAVRETIINAIAHSDYSQKGSPIRIAIYDDKIEIENPGLIPFNLTLDDLYRGISKLRNPVIARILNELKLIERWGSGIRRIIESCENAGLKPPLFEEIGAHFRVTLYTEQVNKPTLDEIEKQILNLLQKDKGHSTTMIAHQIGISPRAARTRLLTLIAKGLVSEIGSSPQDPRKKYYLRKGT